MPTPPSQTTTKTKTMKIKSKGKVYPSSSSSTPFPAPSPAGDSLSVLNLLPAAILSLAVVLSVEDREVLAYMLTRSIKSSNPRSKSKTSNGHKSPVFDCDCFDCYTNYWFKWDTSVNRELIHQAIEAFEENLNNSEQSKNKSKQKSKKKSKEHKSGHRSGHFGFAGKALAPPPDFHSIQIETESFEPTASELVESEGEECESPSPEEVAVPVPETGAVVVRGGSTVGKGLGRKVVPDVIGMFNWRFWSVWSPNV